MMLKEQFNLRTLLLFVVMCGFVFTACNEDDPEPQSAENSITAFTFDGLTPAVSGVISSTNISAEVPNGTDVTSLSPSIVVSEGATVNPASGSAQDFSSPVTYTVTAEDGTAQAYTVTVTIAASDATEMLSFSFEELTPTVDGVITGTDVSVKVPEGTDITGLVPTIVLSGGATVSPASDIAQDFSSDVEYVVTAQDGTTTQTYTVSVTFPTAMITPIWEKNLANGGLPTWFTANNDRDLAVHGDYVYVHNNTDKIRVMSAADGADVSAGFADDDTNPNKEFINGKENFASGNLFLLNVATDDNGVILGSNLRNGNGANAWNLYKWDDKDATQELFFGDYVPLVGEALADNLSVVGSVDGDGFIYAPADGFGGASNAVLKFTITDGVVTPIPLKIELNGIDQIGNGNDAYPTSSASDATIIVAGTGIGGIAEYDQTGALVGKLNAETLNSGTTAPLFSFALDVKPFEISGRKMIATTGTDFGAEISASAGYLYIIDYTNGLENVTADNITRVAFTPDGNIDLNNNGTGGVDVIVEGNTAKVYAMITNFGVGAYTVTYE